MPPDDRATPQPVDYFLLSRQLHDGPSSHLQDTDNRAQQARIARGLQAGVRGKDDRRRAEDRMPSLTPA
jgi:hypothetical protein